ncbi:hypothetical protein BB560_005085 [Smittium megazygosporum]|uniref:Trehalase n=1 Tax=Smittium megazygosporum TaxID=133381 RepID=A0A2T9Z7F5_9FUNG|nr:hypothetical protein BB560_005085 [Smittium megazygosporum]
MEEETSNNSFAPASEYYNRVFRRHSYIPSTSDTSSEPMGFSYTRRGSKDDRTEASLKFLIDIGKVKKLLLEQEDTNGDFQITIKDKGPKILRVPTYVSGGYKTFEIRGTYMISNLLQEIALAEELGKKYVVIDEERLNENPVDRLLRMIRTVFWDDLCRTMDRNGIKKLFSDSKGTEENHGGFNYIYVPFYDQYAFDYYSNLAAEFSELKIKTVRLPRDITPEYVKSLNNQFGILSLAAEVGPPGSGEYGADKCSYSPLPYIVPGGRFNEMYGWDSYFEALGLLQSGKIDLAKAMIDHYVYQINHYGMILNANRSYYLTRSQPPFLPDLLIRTYDMLLKTEENFKWLKHCTLAAIKEHNQVWVSSPRYDPVSGLSTYHPTGIGMPPETEPGHFDHVFKKYADNLGISVKDYIEKYDKGEIKEEELDEYFVHDQAVRESGHDTSYRLDGKCADLATVDLNTLLYLNEISIYHIIKKYCAGEMVCEGQIETHKPWKKKAVERMKKINEYLWCDEAGLYFDYNIKTRKQETFESATTFYPLFAGCCTKAQAASLVEHAIPLLEEEGGLVSTTLKSRGEVSKDRPLKQWDYPFGWAPHQIMVWEGLKKYNYDQVAERLAYRWLYTIVSSYNDYNGVVPEKFDVVDITHSCDVEYGNVGTDFKMVSKSGFGWMNASFEIGLEFINFKLRRALGALKPPEKIFRTNHVTETTEDSLGFELSENLIPDDNKGCETDDTLINCFEDVNEKNNPFFLINHSENVSAEDLFSSLNINENEVMRAVTNTDEIL